MEATETRLTSMPGDTRRRLRVCFLVPQFPHVSEVFIAYQYVAVSEFVDVAFVALRHSGEDDQQPILQHSVFGDLRYVDQHRDTWRALKWIPGIVRHEGLAANSVISAKEIGYRTMWYGARVAADCISVIEDFKPDIIHGHFAGTSQFANVVSRTLGIPYTMMVHGSDIRRTPRFALTDAALARACAVIVPGLSYKNILEELGVQPQRVHVLPYGVSDHFVADQPGRRRHLIAVGRLHPVKGFDCLIDAAALLRDRGVEFTLDIVGDGPMRQQLEEQIRDLGLDDQVKLLGRCTHESLPSYFHQAELAVVSSRDEGFCCVAAEAMACGVPVLATRVGTLTDTVTEELGYLCEPGAASLADAIERALDDPATLAHKRELGIRETRERYNWRAHGQHAIKLWRGVIDVG